ncbi:hypothetical protein [Rhodococcus xishaensis]|uniref:hypothetical protein n=1 Tax=Rhodococcus xishaensis TaxID=2487364 RepID=UPI000FDD3F74|nr:hypothetical protein [Rhodococcus xishaensis]
MAASTGSLGSAGSSSQEEVTLSAAVVDGNEVTVTIDNDTDESLVCTWHAKGKDAADGDDPAAAFHDIVEPGPREEKATIDVDGDYLINWDCTSSETDERWGTEGDQPTADPYAFAIGDDELGEGSLGGDTGSLVTGGLVVGSLVLGGLAIGGLVLG